MYNASKGGFHTQNKSMFSKLSQGSKLATELLTFDYVIIDTCSLMEDAFPIWMDELAQAKKYMDRSNIYVPNKCFAELKRHARDRKEPARKVAAKRALKIIRLAKWHKLLKITKKDKTENFADNAIYVTVSKYRLSSRILVITQDKKLATDLRNLNTLMSQNGRKVDVRKFLPKGELAENRGEDRFPEKSKRRAQTAELRQNQKNNPPSAPNKQDGAKPNKELTKFQKKLLADDARISSTLTNQSYPLDKKIADVQNLLNMFGKLTPEEKATLPLTNSAESLSSALASLKQQSLPKESLVKKEETQAPAKKEDAKPVQPKQEGSKPKPSNKEEGYSASGPTLKDAITACASYYNILFRANGIDYVPQVHGPVDMTENDLASIVKQLEESNGENDKKEAKYKTLKVIAEKKTKGYQVSVSLERKQSAPEKKTQPKPEKSVPQPTEVKGLEEKPVEKLLESKPKARKSSPKKQQVTPAETKEVTEPTSKPVLIVAVPEEKPKPKKKPTASKPDEPKKEAKATTKAKALASKPEAKKDAEKPAAKSSSKKERQTASPKEAPKKANKPTSPKAEKPVASDELKAAKAAEKRLSANVANPNYSNDSKRADILTQIELAKAVKAGESKSLKYSVAKLEKMLSELETK